MIHPTASIHESAYVDEPCEIGAGAKVWHFCHVRSGASIGERTQLGQGCYVGSHVRIGQACKIQNNVSIYEDVTLEHEVFIGPSAVFTNVINPRAAIDRKSEFRATRVMRGATIGANATIVCGVTIGRWAFVGAGAIVREDIPDFALVVGVPGRRIGWMSIDGETIPPLCVGDVYTCQQSGAAYRLTTVSRLELITPSPELRRV